MEIRQNDLRFSIEEITDFMRRVMQLDMTSDYVVALEARHLRAGSWCFNLAGLSLHGRGNKSNFIQEFTGSNRYILDYLIEEVFDRQPEDMREFRSKTAVLEVESSGPYVMR